MTIAEKMRVGFNIATWSAYGEMTGKWTESKARKFFNKLGDAAKLEYCDIDSKKTIMVFRDKSKLATFVITNPGPVKYPVLVSEVLAT